MAIKIINNKGESIILNPSFRIEGLPFQREKQEINILNNDGIYTSKESVKISARTLKISGYYYATSKEDAENQRQQLLKIVNQKEPVEIYPDDNVEKYIEAYFISDNHSFIEGTGRKIASVTLEFKADEPFFWGEEVIQSIPIYYSYDNNADHDKNSECFLSPIHSPSYCPHIYISGDWATIKHPDFFNGVALSNDLIIDGEFEQSSLTENWNYANISNWNYTTATATRDSTYKKTGTYSVKCGIGSGYVYGIAEKILHKVVPNKTYNLNFYVYSANSSSQFIVLFRLYDKNQNNITQNKIIQGFNYSIGYQAQYITGTTTSGSWINKNYSITIPQDVYYIQFAFAYYSGGDGYVWFDNISFTPVSNSEYVEFTFNGTGITVVGLKSFDHGILYYSVDGGSETSVDCYSSSWTVAPLFSVSGLSEEEHVLKIRTSDQKNASSQGYQITLIGFIPDFIQSFDYTGYAETKPIIFIEPLEKSYCNDYKGKVVGSTTENKHIIKTRTGTSSVSPSDGSWIEISDYSSLSISENLGVKTTTTTSGYYPYQMFTFDLSGIDTDVNVVKNNLTEITYEWRGRAKGQNSGERNSALHYIWNGSSWVSLPATGQETSGFDFTRGSDAYQLDGTKVTGNIPRFEAGRFFNYLTENQSNIETDITGFTTTASGTSLLRDTTTCWEGQASLKVTCDGNYTGQGFYTSSVNVFAGRTYTASVYLKGSGTVYLAIEERKADDTIIGSTVSSAITLTSSWQRVSITRTFSNQGFKASFKVYTTSQQNIIFYADGLMINEGDTALEWRKGQSGKALMLERGYTNLFTNPGFESGDLSDWSINKLSGTGTASITSTTGQYYSGSKGCVVNGGNNGVILYQQKGTAGYYASVQFYVKASDLSAIDNTIVKAYVNGSEVNFNYIEPLLNGWYRCSYEYTTVASTNNYWGIKVQPGKTVYIDNAMMVQYSGSGYYVSCLKSYVDIGNSKSTDTVNLLIGQFIDMSKPFTVKVWMKPFSGNAYNPIWFNDKSGNFALYFGFEFAPGKARISYFNTSGTQYVVSSTSAFVKNTWHFLKFVYDGTYYKLYVDNVLACQIQPSSQRIPHKLVSYSSYLAHMLSHLQILNRADESTEDLTRPPQIDAYTVYYADFDGTLDYYAPFKATLTSNLSQYVSSDNKIYVMVRSQSPSDGTNPAEIETDYARLKVKHKYAKNITIIRRNKNLFDNPLPIGTHMQPIPEWNFGTGLSNAYDNVYDTKEQAILVRNYSYAHHGKGQKVILKTNTTYTMSFDLKSPVPCFVNVWYYEPDFSTRPSFYTENYNQYYISNPSATSYKRYSFSFTPRYSHCVITLRIAGSSPANSYWKNLVLVEGTDTNYVEPEIQTIQVSSSLPALTNNDLITIDANSFTADLNGNNIIGYLNNDFLLNGMNIETGKNTLYISNIGACRITMRYRRKDV